MQFLRIIKNIKILLILIIIIINSFNVHISITLPNIKNKSINSINKSFDRNINLSTEFSFSQIKENKNINSKNIKNQIKINQKPFDKIIAIKLLLEIGKHIIQNYFLKETSVVYNRCIESIKENLTYFEIYLKKLWIEMHLIAKNESITDLKNKEFLFDIFKRLYEKNIKLNPKTEAKCRSALMLKPIIKRKDLISILDKEEFFGGFAKLNQKPFIDSIFNVYRHNLPENAFKMINKSSIGLPSFKINSEGLRPIASISAEEIREIQNENNKNFAYNNHIDLIGNYNANQTPNDNLNENKNDSVEIDGEVEKQNQILNKNNINKLFNYKNHKNPNNDSKYLKNNDHQFFKNNNNNIYQKRNISNNINGLNIGNNLNIFTKKDITKNDFKMNPNINENNNNDNNDVNLNIGVKNKDIFNNVEFNSNNIKEIKPILEKNINENSTNVISSFVNNFDKNNNQYINNNKSSNNKFNSKNSESKIVTKKQIIQIPNNNEIEFPGGMKTNLENVEYSLNPNLAPKNIIINRQTTYPKEYESIIKNKLNKIDPKVLNSLNKITKA